MSARILVHSTYDVDGVRRVAIYRRPDGCYDYAVEERCLSEDYELIWSPDFEPSASGVYDTPETALREAARDVTWLQGRTLSTRGKVMCYERREIAIVMPNGSHTKGELLIWEKDPEEVDHVRLTLLVSGEEITQTAEDCFSAFRLIRLELQKIGLVPRCYGASRNVYPSGMSGSMGIGDQAYTLILGQRGQPINIVNIFDDGPDVEPVSVPEQEEYHQAWIRTLA